MRHHREIDDYCSINQHVHVFVLTMTMAATPDNATALTPDDMDLNAETMINLSLLDPPHFGWTAGGGIADLLPPVEVRLSLVSALST